MILPRLDLTTHISDQLNVLAGIVKTRSRASLTDANHILEIISAKFLNTLFGWELENLNAELSNFPAADLGDRLRRIAIQITNEDSSDKIRRTVAKAIHHELNLGFDRLIVFFLLPKKPGLPGNFTQPPDGPQIETWDIADLLKQLQEISDLGVLSLAANILDTEIGKIPAAQTLTPDIIRITGYGPVELVGRESETKLLNDTWHKALSGETQRPRILTFVALGGEGKTSLVAKWASDVARQWDAIFAWSFYGQGSLDQVAGSSDLFFKEALTYFGDKTMADGPHSTFDKGRRLAKLVGEHRALLILDGLEPLQYSPTSPTPGQLKDPGIAAFFKSLAVSNRGLCVVTTRYSLPDLQEFRQTSAPEINMPGLSDKAGAHLLGALGVRGTSQELSALVEDVRGHALTLTLIGGFLRRAFQGDIRQRDRIKFKKADEKIDGGHAFRAMAAYEHWLLDGGDKGLREVAVLRLMGLFDRPADARCLAVLRSEIIDHLNEPLVDLAEEDWAYCLSSLETAKLLTVNLDSSGALISLDAHPLLRAYFEHKLSKQQPDAWRTAHTRLYEHLCATAPDSTKAPRPNPLLAALGVSISTSPTLQDLQPLYQAIAHACHAGLHEKAWTEVFQPRILRGSQFYSYQQLGAVGDDLGALACFFDARWTHVSPNVTELTRGRVLNSTGLRLRMMGRLREAVEVQKEAVKIDASQEPMTPLRNLSEVQLELGEIEAAIQNSIRCVAESDKVQSKEQMIMTRTTLGDALHQAGRQKEARNHLRKAEQISRKWTRLRFLPSLHGFRYCDLLLSLPERIAWQRWLDPNRDQFQAGDAKLTRSCRSVFRRATATLKLAEDRGSPLDIAFDHLTLGRIAFYEVILLNASKKIFPASKAETVHSHELGSDPKFETALRELDAALGNIYRASSLDEVPRVLLACSWLRFLLGLHFGPESAQSALDDAWEIASRGPMELHMADIHLHRARLFRHEKPYPWSQRPNGILRGPEDDLAAAEAIIKRSGYLRREGELSDAKQTILGTLNTK